MRLIFISFLSFFLFTAYAQDTSKVESRLSFELLSGGFYKTFIGSRYISTTSWDSDDSFEDHQYERFTKNSTIGFELGGQAAYRISNRWKLRTGLIYCNRRDIYTNNQDTVIKYGYFPFQLGNMRSIKNVLEYNYNYHNFEIPLLASFEIDKIIISAGARIALFTFRKADYTYVIYQAPQQPVWTTSEKSVRAAGFYFNLFPSLQASYTIDLKKVCLAPYAGLDFDSDYGMYIKTGVLFFLLKNNTH